MLSRFLVLIFLLAACAPEKPACSVEAHGAIAAKCRLDIKANCQIDPATGKYDLKCPTVVACYKQLDEWQVCK
jgi:hypothetical protein